jgi:ABC-type multidrug transport system ATPase subunit
LSSEYTVELSNVTKDYGSKLIGPVSFQLKSGTVMGFLGPNGSGKTTCIRLLLGLMRSSSGTVRLDGRDPLKQHKEALRRVGYSPELPNLQTFLSSEELLSLVGSELGLSRNEVRRESDRVLELVGLLNYRRLKIGKLSKGMIQRLSVAQALMGSPKILILDEPVIGLDPAGTAHFRTVFRDFARAGGTVLLSSHTMSEVEALCDYIYMIHNGREIFSGTVEEVISQTFDSKAIIVEARGITEAAISSIRRLDGVISVLNGSSVIEITAQNGKDLRPQISRIIVESGADLHSIKFADNLLEKAYIEALRREKALAT